MIFIELSDIFDEKYIINPENIEYIYRAKGDKHETEFLTGIRLLSGKYIGSIGETPEEIIAKIEQAKINVFFKPVITSSKQEEKLNTMTEKEYLNQFKNVSATKIDASKISADKTNNQKE